METTRDEARRKDNLTYFTTKHSSIYEAYQNYGRELHENGGPLDERCRWIVKCAVSAACGHELALGTHIEKALAAGCSREEIEHAILLTAPTAGFPTMMTALLTLRTRLGE